MELLLKHCTLAGVDEQTYMSSTLLSISNILRDHPWCLQLAVAAVGMLVAAVLYRKPLEDKGRAAIEDPDAAKRMIPHSTRDK